MATLWSLSIRCWTPCMSIVWRRLLWSETKIRREAPGRFSLLKDEDLLTFSKNFVPDKGRDPGKGHWPNGLPSFDIQFSNLGHVPNKQSKRKSHWTRFICYPRAFTLRSPSSDLSVSENKEAEPMIWRIPFGPDTSGSVQGVFDCSLLPLSYPFFRCL